MVRCQNAVAESNAACTAGLKAGPTFWTVTVKAAAAPVALNVIGFPVIPLPVAVAVAEFAPGAAPTVQPPTCATPNELVFTVAVVRLPPPDTIANVTLTFPTGRLLASDTRTAGRILVL